MWQSILPGRDLLRTGESRQLRNEKSHTISSKKRKNALYFLEKESGRAEQNSELISRIFMYNGRKYHSAYIYKDKKFAT